MAKRKILVLSPLPAMLVKALFDAQAGDLPGVEAEAVTYEGGCKQDLMAAVADADVIIGDYQFHAELDAEVLGAAKRCLLVQQPSTGYQHIDVDAARELGIPVANVSGANALAVAEHTIMVVLGCLKKLIMQHEKTARGEWAQDEMVNYGVFELFGKTFGIVGMGLIGREVAGRARPFGCNLVYYDVTRLPEEIERELAVSYRELDALVAEADVISVHVPLTPETDNMFSAERIAAMKPNAVLVNVARGSIVDEAALAAALVEGRLGGAGLDVFAEEPVGADNPLLDAPNVILTPHTAGATNESRFRIIGVAIANVVSVLNGQVPQHIVNGVTPRFE